MVHITSVLLALVLSCPISVIHAAPVNSTVDPDTLLKNGQTAQNLNVAFNNLTINDPCQSGQEACVSGALAKCDNAGKWEAQQCPSNTQCFALPDIRSGGTKLRCTSQDRASTLIQASGAQGGIFGNNSTNSSDSSSATQTVTVLVAPSGTQTLNSQTTTLDSAGVSSLLQSLESSGVSGTATSSGTDSASASATVTSSGDAATTTDAGAAGAQGALATGGQGAAAAAAPTTIILTGSSPTATTSSVPSSTSGASNAAESAPPSNGGYKF